MRVASCLDRKGVLNTNGVLNALLTAYRYSGVEKDMGREGGRVEVEWEEWERHGQVSRKKKNIAEPSRDKYGFEPRFGLTTDDPPQTIDSIQCLGQHNIKWEAQLSKGHHIAT